MGTPDIPRVFNRGNFLRGDYHKLFAKDRHHLQAVWLKAFGDESGLDRIARYLLEERAGCPGHQLDLNLRVSPMIARENRW
jgi:hypothetical protein